MKGNKVEFTFGNETAQAKYSGTLDGDKKMSGTVDYGEVGTGTLHCHQRIIRCLLIYSCRSFLFGVAWWFGLELITPWV